MGLPLARPPALVSMRSPVAMASVMMMTMNTIMIFGIDGMMMPAVRSRSTVLVRARSVALVVVVVASIAVRRVFPVATIVANMTLSAVSAMMVYPCAASRNVISIRLASGRIIPLAIMTIMVVVRTTRMRMMRMMRMMMTGMILRAWTATETNVRPFISLHFLPPIARTAGVVGIP